ncbi:MAG: hypothetical protein LBG81_00710 [Coriobacteriaceae bacterium]|jgi:hypothetical protein|nr:hypothetical protein [Coriobacteriaceae bacterium]
MGTIRDFTDEAKDQMLSAVDEAEQQREGWLGMKLLWDSVTDWGIDCNIERFGGDVKGYYDSVMDKHNTTRDQLESIFSKAYAAEDGFCTKLGQVLADVEGIRESFTNLAALLDPSAGGAGGANGANGANGAGGMPLLLPHALFCTLLVETDQQVKKALAQLVEYDASGKAVYHWDNISSMLNRDPASIRPTEYTALMQLIAGMTVRDGVGNVVADTNALARFIRCGYPCEMETHMASQYLAGGVSIPDFSSAYVEYRYTATPAFQVVSSLFALYAQQVLQNNGYVFFNGRDDAETVAARQRLDAEVFKASLLTDMAWNVPKITQYGSLVALDGKSSLYISIARDEANKCYKVDANGFLNDYVGGITIYDFNANNLRRFHLNEAKLASSLYQIKEQEFLKDLGEEVIGQVIGSLGAGRGLTLATEATYFMGQESFKFQEIDLSNGKVNELLRNMNLEETLAAFKAGASVSTYHDVVSLFGVCINERELQIAINAYNDKTGSHLTLIQMENDFDGIVTVGEESDIVGSYVAWYHDNETDRDVYRAKLADALTDYVIQNPGCPYRKLEDLSNWQIMQLDAKLNDPAYDLDLVAVAR